MEKKIGRGTWIDKLAYEMLEREKRLCKNTDMLRVESGLGASGIPHVGSLGDAVRAYGVKLALQDMGYKSELIAYSDDMDGLRKIPRGFPNSLVEHLAKPVSFVPDPYDCHDSFGSHMSSLLLEGLDDLGVCYEFKRAYDTYRKGDLAEQIHVILSKREEIGKKISDAVGQEKFTKYLPYYVVCANCKKLYTTESLEYDGQKRTVSYVCKDAEIGGNTIKGCGHEGVSRIGVDLGKLAWKVEFAARWMAYDIRFEAYGKDIMDSVHVNDWVAESILGYAPPHHVKYEMFLDRGGKKISKSLGNVITSQRWLRYGSKNLSCCCYTSGSLVLVS
ncbi:MAG: lysine--tRNA ligase [Cenarchaeum symbiont of Oopsacas minuta]|nr:lysine--tRNA ligase [Cenarchaeum symbiont of Oopsacas minuta]